MLVAKLPPLKQKETEMPSLQEYKKHLEGVENVLEYQDEVTVFMRMQHKLYTKKRYYLMNRIRKLEATTE